MAKKKKKNGMQIPRVIIHIGKFIQFFSPKLATSYVRYLFQKPIRHKTPKPEHKILQSAEISYLDIPEIKKKVAVYHWGTGDKKILMVHGWSGRATQLYRIVEKLLDMNYEVWSFDGPAHGKSSGRITMMPEFIKTVEKIVETHGKFYAAVGHSLGGIALLNVQGNHAAFDKICVIGTPDSIKDIFYGFVNKLELKRKVAEYLIAFFEKITGKTIENFHGSHHTKQIDIPVLIIHDEEDYEVPIKDAINNHKYLKHGKLIKTNGLGHARILKNPEVVEQITSFIQSNQS